MDTLPKSRTFARMVILLIIILAAAWFLFSKSSPVRPQRAVAPGTGGARQAQDGGVPFTESGCVVTGCSKEVCASEEVITACLFKPEYLCYRKARCERQAAGECGWTVDDKLTRCLTTAPADGPDLPPS